VSIVPDPSLPRGGPPRVVCARQADGGLDRLLTAVLTARSAMRTELKRRPPVTPRQSVVRHQLLDSLEAYTAGLTARGLPAPPKLRDELALQRSLDGHR
jgi:hypothetical protein